MKQLLVIVFVLATAACGTQSTEVKADSTAVAVDSTVALKDTVAVDTAK